MSEGPLIVQSDKTLLLDIDHPLSTECRRAIAPFAELERSPEHIHTYRLTNLGLWNARAAGHDAELVIDTLIKYSRYAVPHSLLVDVAETHELSDHSIVTINGLSSRCILVSPPVLDEIDVSVLTPMKIEGEHRVDRGTTVDLVDHFLVDLIALVLFQSVDIVDAVVLIQSETPVRHRRAVSLFDSAGADLANLLLGSSCQIDSIFNSVKNELDGDFSFFHNVLGGSYR